MTERLRIAFLALGGAVLMATGIGFGVANLRFLDGAARADGIVVALVTKRVRGTDLTHPVVRYRPLDAHEPVEFTARPGLWPSPYAVGDPVRVAYRRVAPEDARIVSFWMLWLLPLLTSALGAGCGFAAWHRARSRLTRPGATDDRGSAP